VSLPRPFRSSRTLATAVVVLLGVNAAVAIVMIGLRLAERGLLQRAARGQLPSVHEAARSDDRIAAVAGIELGLVLLTAIVWVVWQYRAQANLHAVGVPHLRYTPGWAAGWWFVPFANLVKPFQTVRELWKASGAEDADGWSRRPTWPVIGWWWASWLLSGVVARVGVAAVQGAETIDAFLFGNLWLTVSEVTVIVAAILAIVIVRSVDERQGRLPTRPREHPFPPLPPPPTAAAP